MWALRIGDDWGWGWGRVVVWGLELLEAKNERQKHGEDTGITSLQKILSLYYCGFLNIS